MKKILVIVFIFSALGFMLKSMHNQYLKDLDTVAQRIYQNECSSNPKNLVFWNEGEDFPSLGIGHFIWYPKNNQGPYQESFPALVDYMIKQKADVPAWLTTLDPRSAPWNNREEMQASVEQVKSLRQFLSTTKRLQTQFMVQRAYDSLFKMTNQIPLWKQFSICAKFFSVAVSPYGMYPIIDYVNFKGEGLSPDERYQDQGWGLLQVFEMMPLTWPGKGALQEFSQTANIVLINRIKNAPAERNEQRWLKGWQNRLNTYTNIK